MRKLTLLVLCIVGVQAFPPARLSADTLVTANGKQFEGTVVETDGQYVLTLPSGIRMTFPKAMVRKVVKGPVKSAPVIPARKKPPSAASRPAAPKTPPKPTRPRGRPAPRDPTARLVWQLGRGDFGDRESAQRKLLDLGSKAEKALRAALAAGDASKETRQRIGFILDHLDVPTAGRVWRGWVGARPPLGINNGDVLAKVNGVSISSLQAMRYALIGGDGDGTLTIWRKGKGYFVLKESEVGRAAGTVTWPDSLQLYEKYGTKGRWDRDVIRGIKSYYAGSGNAARFFDSARKAGCRDAVFLAAWLQELREAYARKAMARVLGNGKLWQDVRGGCPGGLAKYGLVPYEKVHAYLMIGKAKEAKDCLADALIQAKEVGAWQGLGVLRCLQVEMNRTAPLKDAIAFWQAHAGEILSQPKLADSLIPILARQLASTGEPQQAVAFLKQMPDSPVAIGLKGYFASQCALKAKAGRKHTGLKPALIRLIPGAVTRSTTLGHYTDDPGTSLTGPSARIDCDIRLTSVPPARSNWRSLATINLYSKSRGARIWFGRTGRINFRDFSSQLPVDAWTPALTDPGQWHTISLELHSAVSRAHINGRLLWTTFHPLNLETALEIWVSTSGCSAEFRNLKIYAYTKTAVDNQVVEQLFRQRTETYRAGNLKEAKRIDAKLMRVLRPIPQAQDTTDKMKKEMQLFEKIMSKDGVKVCTEQMLAFGRKYRRPSGLWQLKDGGLVARPEPGRRSVHIVLPIPSPDDVEITGILETKNAGIMSEVSLMWNSAATDTKTMLAFLPRVSGVSFGGRAPRDRKDIQRVDFSSPLPFCIRVRGGKGALFLRSGSKPDAQVSGLKRTGRHLVLLGNDLSAQTRIRFSKLTIRHLPKDTRLDAPARMPSLKSKPGDW